MSPIQRVLEAIFVEFFDDYSLRAVFQSVGLDKDLPGPHVPFAQLAHDGGALASRRGQPDRNFVQELYRRAKDERVLAPLRAIAEHLGVPDLTDGLKMFMDRRWPPEGAATIINHYTKCIRSEASWVSTTLQDAGAPWKAPRVEIDLSVTTDFTSLNGTASVSAQSGGWGERNQVPHELTHDPLSLIDLLNSPDARYGSWRTARSCPSC